MSRNKTERCSAVQIKSSVIIWVILLSALFRHRLLSRLLAKTSEGQHRQLTLPSHRPVSPSCSRTFTPMDPPRHHPADRTFSSIYWRGNIQSNASFSPTSNPSPYFRVPCTSCNPKFQHATYSWRAHWTWQPGLYRWFSFQIEKSLMESAACRCGVMRRSGHAFSCTSRIRFSEFEARSCSKALCLR